MIEKDPSPDNEAMRLHELRIVMYLDEHGEPFVSYTWVGEEAPFITAIGMVESAKLTMNFIATHPDDEDLDPE